MQWMERELQYLDKQGLLRRLRRVDSPCGPWMNLEGKEVLSLSSNDYLGLASDARVTGAMQEAVGRFGAGAGAARLICGNMSIHEELEDAIARFKGVEAALLFSTGYMANAGILGAMAGRGDVVFCDRLAHASIIDGCILSRAKVVRYRHNSVEHLQALMEKAPASGRRFIVTEGVFSMDGDVAPLPRLLTLARRHDALLILDEAHATGVLGATGRGTAEHYGCPGSGFIRMGTMGKALGTFGAFVAGDRVIREYLINRSRSFMFTTALPPAVAAAALRALGIVEEEPQRVARLRENATALRAGLRDMGYAVPDGETPIIPVMVKDAKAALNLSRTLLGQGVYAPAVRPPTVPQGESRIRVTITAAHGGDDIGFALEAFKAAGRKEGLL